MGRPKRSDEAGVIYHMLNRANRRATIFHKHDDYEAFERILADGRIKGVRESKGSGLFVGV